VEAREIDVVLGREVGGGAEQQRDTCRAWFGGRSRICVCMPMSRRETGTARGQEARASSAAARAQWWTPRMVTSGSWVQSPSRPRVSTLVRAAALVQPRRAKTSRRVSSGRARRKSPASAFCGCAIGMAPSKISEDRGCVCEPTNIPKSQNTGSIFLYRNLVQRSLLLWWRYNNLDANKNAEHPQKNKKCRDTLAISALLLPSVSVCRSRSQIQILFLSANN
jgi:hypothetical protein